MSLPYKPPDPLRMASALGPLSQALGDPDFLADLLSSGPAGVVLVEATEGLPIVYCNDSFERWARPGRQPVVGSSLAELFDWSDHDAIADAHRQVIRSGRPLHRRAVPYRLRGGAPIGEPCYWSVSHFPLRGRDGRVTHVLSLAVDVTEQAGQRARAAESHQRVLSALGAVARHLQDSGDLPAFFGRLSTTVAELASASRAAFWLHDPAAGTISPQAGSFGFDDAELKRLCCLPCAPARPGLLGDVVFEDRVVRVDVDMDGPDVAGLCSQLRALGVRDAVAVPWRTRNLRLGALTIYGATRPWGFAEEDVWVLQSAAAAAALVWEHKLADDAMADLQAREADTLRQQIEQTIKLEQLQADYLKLASHELRGPLGLIRGYVSMMGDGTFGAMPDELRQVIPVLLARIEEMNRLINEMLETARLEDGALQLQLSPLDLRPVVTGGVQTLEPLADPGHRLLASVPGEAVMVEGDASRLTMIVANLVHNAIKYSPAGGEVRVVCRIQDGSAMVDVSDQGIGIAAADRDRLFTRFGRIESPQTHGIPGTGLGLYLARDLARRHGGDITVASEPGRGSTFTLSLPLAA
jgi:signal transduction histidine kinase